MEMLNDCINEQMVCEFEDFTNHDLEHTGEDWAFEDVSWELAAFALDAMSSRLDSVDQF